MIPNCSAVSKGITKLAKTWMCDFKGDTRQRSKTGPIGRNRTANIPTTAFQSIYGLFVSIRSKSDQCFYRKEQNGKYTNNSFPVNLCMVSLFRPARSALSVRFQSACDRHRIFRKVVPVGFFFLYSGFLRLRPFGKSPVTRTFNNFKRLTDAITESSNVLL